MAPNAGIYSFALISLESFFDKRGLPLNSPDLLCLTTKPKKAAICEA